MSAGLDWSTWLLALAVIALFVAFFWLVGRALLDYARRLVEIIQNWPQIRRGMVEAEVRAGGRYPLWFRAVRVLLIVALIGLAALLLWRRFR